MALVCFLYTLDAQNRFKANEATPYPENITGQEAKTALKSAPKGYKVFYISHYGRHGSRTENEGKRFIYLLSALDSASREGLLTPNGETLLRAIRAEYSYAQGRFGHLTPLGAAQHRAIAGRMIGNFPLLFSGPNASVTCRSTSYPRCILSMTNFASALQSAGRHTDITFDTSDALTDSLNPKNTRAMKEAVAAEISRQFKKMTADTTTFLQGVFTDVAAARRHFGNVENLCTALFFAWGMGFNIPQKVDISTNVSAYILEQTARILNTRLYLLFCNSKRWGRERLARIAPLVRDVISLSDKAIEGKGPAADLRFGHDGALMSLLCALGYEGIPAGMEEDAVEGFRTCETIPMAANVQLVFLKGTKADEVLVLCLCNEKPFIPQGIRPVSGYLCKWPDVRNLLSCNTKNKE